MARYVASSRSKMPKLRQAGALQTVNRHTRTRSCSTGRGRVRRGDASERTASVAVDSGCVRARRGVRRTTGHARGRVARRSGFVGRCRYRSPVAPPTGRLVGGATRLQYDKPTAVVPAARASRQSPLREIASFRKVAGVDRVRYLTTADCTVAPAELNSRNFTGIVLPPLNTLATHGPPHDTVGRPVSLTGCRNPLKP